MKRRRWVALTIGVPVLVGCGDSTPPAAAEIEPEAPGSAVVASPRPEITPPPATVATSVPEPAGIGVAVDLNAGRQTYIGYCGHCHDAGEGHPGTMRLAVRVGDDHAVLLGRSDLAPEYVQYVVRNGLGMMPPFRPTEISDQALAHLAAYVGHNFDTE